MKSYLLHEYSAGGDYVSSRDFRSQQELRDYLSSHGASYDAHKLSDLGDDSIVISKINLGGDYVEVEELALPGRTDSVVIDGIEYISLDGAVRKYDMSLSQVKYARKSRGLKAFAAGSMNRIFVEDNFLS